jgi:hypothetical protein
MELNPENTEEQGRSRAVAVVPAGKLTTEAAVTASMTSEEIAEYLSHDC